jgi:hypothetical protein
MDKNIQLFSAAYYADIKQLKIILQSVDDLHISLKVPAGDYCSLWKDNKIDLSVLDILNWHSYAFWNDYETTSYKVGSRPIDYATGFNPSGFYCRVLEAIEWLCHAFQIKSNYALKDYSHYQFFQNCTGENWLDEDEVKELLLKGFRRIDIDLANAAQAGNGQQVYTLLKQGASAAVDLFDEKPYVGTVYDSLVSSASYNGIETIKYLNDETFRSGECYPMLSSLYQIGVNEYILDILELSV